VTIPTTRITKPESVISKPMYVTNEPLSEGNSKDSTMYSIKAAAAAIVYSSLWLSKKATVHEAVTVTVA
jgi:hypothetical protein